MDSEVVARWLVVSGLLIAALGLVVYLMSRLSLFGRFPGDISLRGDGFWVFIPLGASLLLSVVLTIVINIVIRLR